MTPLIEPVIVVVTVAAPAAATAVSGLSPAFATMVSAFTAAAVALILFLLKDVALARWNETRADRKTEAQVYRRYLAPLADACTKLVWRGDEIFVKQRHAYLKTTTRPLDFTAYKRRSTLYRLACLIGWIRAMSIELAALTRTGRSSASPLSDDIKAFQAALADGPHVEQHRLQRICGLWNLDLTSLSEADLEALAMKLEVEMHRALTRFSCSDEAALGTITKPRQLKVCEALALFLTSRLGVVPLAPTTVKTTVEEAVGCLTFREALIYRDWQDALGDAMLTPDPDAERRYKLIGYEAFETLLDEAATPWIRVFAACIDDIDFEEADPNDFRAPQLARTLQATARMLISLSTSTNSDLTDAKTLEAAKTLDTAIRAAQARV